MESKDTQNKVKSSWKKILLGLFYMFLGAIIGVHICILLISKDAFAIDKLDGNMPNLLMFALVMASFVPMLVYSFTFNLLKNEKANALRFYYVMDFLVSEATFLITISILIGCFVFIETNVHRNEIASRVFLRIYYLWYFVVAILHSIAQFLCTEVGKKIQEELGRRAFWGYTISIYLWVGAYMVFALILLGRYFDNYYCSNSVVWLKLLIIITSLWLLSFSVMWVIPAFHYQPLQRSES